MIPPIPCPVCRGVDTWALVSRDGRDYWACSTCAARFMAPAHRLTRDAERRYYRRHENDVDDPAYRRFLAKLADPLTDRLARGSRGLDYGCGPGPALAEMMREEGHAVALYDPLFAPDESVLDATYDFVTCTETAEHFHDPHAEFARLDALLKPGGWLAVMTCFQTDDARFKDWHYRRDPTHVVFYRAATFTHIARRFAWRLEVPVKDVALFHKTP